MNKSSSSIQRTQHVETRLRQRGMREADLSFIYEYGSEVANGYMITERDAGELERRARLFIETAHRLKGKRLVADGNVAITVFHSNDAQQKRLC